MGVSVIDPFDDGGLEFSDAVEGAAPDALASSFSEQAFDEIEPRAGCRREVQLAARIALSQRFTTSVLCVPVVVEDEVQVEMGRGLAQELPQECQELLGAVTGQALADDRAACHVESGEQRGGPIALVVVCQGAGAALLERQARLRAVEGLELALLVDRKHQGFVRRGKIEADILDLGDEVRVVGDLEVAHQMWLEPVLLSDALHARMADTHRIGNAAHTPVRGVGRAFLDCFLDHPELEFVGDRLAAGRLGASLDEAAERPLRRSSPASARPSSSKRRPCA